MKHIRIRIVDRDLDTRRERPGTATWANDKSGEAIALVYACPCGCKKIGIAPISGKTKYSFTWIWDGNRDNPTLIPDITRKCGWFGTLERGIFKGDVRDATEPTEGRAE